MERSKGEAGNKEWNGWRGACVYASNEHAHLYNISL